MTGFVNEPGSVDEVLSADWLEPDLHKQMLRDDVLGVDDGEYALTSIRLCPCQAPAARTGTKTVFTPGGCKADQINPRPTCSLGLNATVLL